MMSRVKGKERESRAWAALSLFLPQSLLLHFNPTRKHDGVKEVVALEGSCMDARKLVRRVERDPWNRLNSILEDADWVASFCDTSAANLPVIANLRCGAWYVVPPGNGSCYFKSTDGHTLQWHFSLKRYNLDLLNTIQEQGGCVIVDSTRRGKSFPDALSKTVPIWCAVLNAASLKRYGRPAVTPLVLPEHVVSPSEEQQIASKLDHWTDLLLSSELPVPSLEKPLRPLFVSHSHQDEAVTHVGSRSEWDYYPVVLVSASQMVPTPGLDPLHSPVVKSRLNLSKETEALRMQSQYIYVQGSGDDEDMWSYKLTPAMFWKPANLQLILSQGGGGEKLEAILKLIVEQSKLKPLKLDLAQDTRVGEFPIFLGTRSRDHVFSIGERDKYQLIIQADSEKRPEEESEARDQKCSILRLGIPSGKRGIHAFRKALSMVIVSRFTRRSSIVLVSSAVLILADCRSRCAT
jgi:tRNA A64-2'-O-ribosylphosphate transferase